VTLLHWILAAVAAQRLLEVAIARRNEARLRTMGGIESGAGHYPLIVALHVAWLGAMAAFVPEDASADWRLLTPFGGLQIARYWVIATLGSHWTTRIITIPGSVLVRRGPYRLMRHPNYAIVVAEIALFPLAFGAWEIALVLSALNALLISYRIHVENAALDRYCVRLSDAG
jgi:methyltransferase